jgi:hypothetical protein
MLPALVLASLAWAASAADDEESPGAIDPTIAYVEMGGVWTGSKLHGLYRAVVQNRCSVEHCYDRLFVQWLAEGSGGRIAATKYIVEVGDLTHVTQVHFVGNARTKLEVQHSRDDERWTRCLTLGAEGRYTASEGACPR